MSDTDIALTIQCPFCGEPIGAPCRSRSIKRPRRRTLKQPHLRRILKAKGKGL